MPINLKAYHPDWKAIRKAVIERAGNKCEKCGIENHQPLPAKEFQPRQITVLFVVERITMTVMAPLQIVKLNAAHLDHNRENNEDENLMALCQRCHLLHDTVQRVFSFKYGKETQYLNGKLF